MSNFIHIFDIKLLNNNKINIKEVNIPTETTNIVSINYYTYIIMYLYLQQCYIVTYIQRSFQSTDIFRFAHTSLERIGYSHGQSTRIVDTAGLHRK